MIQYIADAEPTATSTPAWTRIMTLPTDTLTINAYRSGLVTLTYAFRDGGLLIREIRAGRIGHLSATQNLELAFNREVQAALALGYTDKLTSVWSCDPWDLISTLDAAPSF